MASRFLKKLKTPSRENLWVGAIFLAVLAAGVLWLLFAPKQAFSPEENRELEPTPHASVSNVLDGSFMKSMENYVCDHFAFRKAFVSLNTSVQLWMGKRDLASDYSDSPADGGVYFGKDGHIYEVLLPDTSGIFRGNAEALADFAKNAGAEVAILPVPSGSQEQPQNLPAFAPNYDQRNEFRRLQTAVGASADVVDVFDALSLSDGQDYYFKTDHHWTAQGAYVGYKALMGALGIQPTPLSDFRFVSSPQPFYGTLYSKAILNGQEPDVFSYPEYQGAWNLTQQTGKSVRNGIYWDEFLTQKDQYSFYLGGNPAETVIRNPSAPGGKLLLLKDSFANSMVPYLATNFSEIHMIDLRYYNQDIYEYIKQNGITQIAAIYSIEQLCDVSLANKLTK